MRLATEAPPPGWVGAWFKPNPDVLLAAPDWVHVTVSPSLALTYPALVFCPALRDSLLSLTRDSWDRRQTAADDLEVEDPTHIADQLAAALSCSSDSDEEDE